MFSLAYVILPFSDMSPAEAITASLARFQGGLRGDVPDEWLGFDNETEAFREAHETRFTFTDNGQQGFGIEGGQNVFWYVNTDTVRADMRARGQASWTVARISRALREALDQPAPKVVDVRSDRNIELVATLLEDARAGREHAVPGTLVLPPGVVTDHSRWLHTWPELGPVRAFSWLGLGTDATWGHAMERAG